MKQSAADCPKYILVITNIVSKLTKAVPLKTITTYKVAKDFLEYWCFNYEFPAIILSDNGS